MLRKRLKRKRRSFPICKPSRSERTNRWHQNEQLALNCFEKAIGLRDWALFESPTPSHHIEGLANEPRLVVKAPRRWTLPCARRDRLGGRLFE